MIPSNLQPLLEKVARLFTKDMPFMKPFSATTEIFNEEKVVLKFEMSEALIGNVHQKILHGGAISTMLDSVGGMVAMSAVFTHFPADTKEEQIKRLMKTCTINLNIHYLRPGRGKEGDHFIATAEVVRCGAKITVCDLKLEDQEGNLLAIGTGTYKNG